MSNTGAGPSKVRPGSSQPSESSKRKRGMFQKDCELFSSGNSLFEILRSLVLVFDGLSVYLEGAVQHMMYGFGDDANVCHLFLIPFNLVTFLWRFPPISMPAF